MPLDRDDFADLRHAPPDEEERDSLGFTHAERDMIRHFVASKHWKLLRDALCLWRERVNQSTPNPEARNLAYLLGRKEGELFQLNRLLREGPYLAVYYNRHARQQEGSREARSDPTLRPPGEPPDME